MSLKRPSENISDGLFCIKNQSTRHLALNSADIRFTGVDGTGQLLDFNLVTFLFGCIQLGLRRVMAACSLRTSVCNICLRVSLGLGLGAGVTTGAVRITGALYLLYEELRDLF